MRVFWSVVLAGGLLLVGFDVYEGRRGEGRTGEARGGARMSESQPTVICEDGTGMPPNRPR
jgi:hypothetical protein